MNCLGREVTCFYATILQKKEYFCESIIYGMKIDNLEDIKNLIVQTENEQLEFKETTGQLERGMETLCAFLNGCLLYTSPSPRDKRQSRMPSSA